MILRDYEIIMIFLRSLSLVLEFCGVQRVKDEPTELATHMLTLMVRGIFINLEYPYASFPTTGKKCFVQYYDTHCCTNFISGITGEFFLLDYVGSSSKVVRVRF